jgi:hypothetical protein
MLAVLLSAGVRAARAENVNPTGENHAYAWGENVGWIYAEPFEVGGPGMQVGDASLQGWLWGENIGWISLSCADTNACADTTYGVANDGFGHLSGFAWSENAGWINFGPDTCQPDPACGVRIDPVTGYFSGAAWGENIGWISFDDGATEFWTTQTSWCLGTTGPPGTGFALSASRIPGAKVQLSWSPLANATWYDVETGSLSALRAAHGDFSQATSGCAVSRTTSTTATVSVADPPPGQSVWLLVRGADCRGHGSWDSGAPSQHGSRDAGIAASGLVCP